MTTNEAPAPHGKAVDWPHSQEQRLPRYTDPDETPDFATVYVSKRFRLPLLIACLIVRLAQLGSTLS